MGRPRKKKPVEKSARETLPASIVEEAKRIGFTEEQIANCADPEKLKALIIQANPESAVRLLAQPVPVQHRVAEPKVFVDGEHIFGVEVAAGFSSTANRARKEQEQIDAEIRRRGIHNVETMTIARHMKPDARGRLHSTINVKYRKEV